jgi:hypothetical protein
MSDDELEAFCQSQGAYNPAFQQERQRREQKKRLDLLASGQSRMEDSLHRIHRVDYWILVVGIVAALAGIVAAVATVILLLRA